MTKAKKIEFSSILEIFPKKRFRGIIKWWLRIRSLLKIFAITVGIRSLLKIFAIALCGFTILVDVYNMKTHLDEVRYQDSGVAPYMLCMLEHHLKLLLQNFFAVFIFITSLFYFYLIN